MRIKLLACFLMLLLLNTISFSVVEAQDKAILHFFWGDGCPHCAEEKPFLEKLEKKYPQLEVKQYEVWYNQENAKLFSQMAKAYGKEARGVPTTFLSNNVWIGWTDQIGKEIEEKVNYCVQQGCINPIQKLEGAQKEEASESPEETTPETTPEEELCIHVFLKDGCPQCDRVASYLDSLSKEFNLKLKMYDVSAPEEKEIYEEFKKTYGLYEAGFPIVFIGDRYLIGERSIRENIEQEITSCLKEECICPTEKVKAQTPYPPRSEDITPEEENVVKLPFVGEVDLSSMSALVATVLIAFVDGFNPCSLWVLTFLLGIVAYSGSRGKIIIVGATFLIVTALTYGLFILGIFNVFQYIVHLLWIRVVVSLIALTFAVVNIKDYFWYKKGISFTIPQSYKPKIFENIRNIMNQGQSTPAIILATATMALGVTLVELPCTAGFPVMWSGMLAAQNIVGSVFAFFLFIYMLIYLLDELLVFGTVSLTLKASKLEEKHGRLLKLIGGMVMLALAITFLFFPQLMSEIKGSIIVVGAALLASLILVLLHRKVLPKLTDS